MSNPKLGPLNVTATNKRPTRIVQFQAVELPPHNGSRISVLYVLDDSGAMFVRGLDQSDQWWLVHQP
jgi:hypothetical protein